MPGPDRDFWQQRFERQQTPWDRGGASPQLARWWADGTLAAGQRVAVPGCGSGHDVLALARGGCAIAAIDYADAAVTLTRERLAAAGAAAAVEQADVLAWQPAAPLDAVFEQTCWCALHPDQWAAYAQQLQGWLRPRGPAVVAGDAMPAPRRGRGPHRGAAVPHGHQPAACVAAGRSMGMARSAVRAGAASGGLDRAGDRAHAALSDQRGGAMRSPHSRRHNQGRPRSRSGRMPTCSGLASGTAALSRSATTKLKV